MKLQFFCPRWGSEHFAWEAFMVQVKQAGYDGIEWGIANHTDRKEIETVCGLAEKSGLRLIAQHYQTADADFEAHRAAYTNWWETIKGFPWVKVNSQTGKDFFSSGENTELIGIAGTCSKETGVPVIHETHRGKFSFAAHVTKPYLDNIPWLRLTLDLSHWICVSESWLEGQQDAIETAIGRTDHIHARVGYTEGPQIPDPRSPEWDEAVRFHLKAWQKIIELKKQEKAATLTITPEFGPYPYMVQLPYSKKPIADQWEINVYIMNLLKKRYAF